MAGKKVILAYSGGLDTSIILRWLIDKGYDVIAVLVDVGQKEDFKEAEAKALKLGASKVYIEDAKEEFITDYIFPAIKANALYEGKYLLGTSLARPLIAKRQVEIAVKEGTNIVSHGATGKGNDQVRFEMTYIMLMPDVEILAPWKMQEFLDQFEGREDMLNYAEEKGIPVKATKKAPWSSDPNLMHISYEAGILEDPDLAYPEECFEMTVSPQKAPDKETEIELVFEKGIPVKLVDKTHNKTLTSPIGIFTYLNEIAGMNGVGRTDLVENRFVGMKSRGVYETPAGTVLITAHRDIEGLTVDREVMHIRDSLIPKIAELIYNGFWFSPEMEFLMAAIDKSQEHVSGTVKLSLYKGNIIFRGRRSDDSLYSEEIASMDVHGGYDQKDAEGFIKLNALRLKASAHRMKD